MRPWLLASAAAAAGLLLAAAYFRRSASSARPWAALDAIVFSGPSGVGKGTIIKKLMQQYPGRFAFSVSHTTRAPRDGEVDGVNYHFTTLDAMKAMVAEGGFLECCTVHGNMYGTSKKALEDVKRSGKLPIIEIDVQGVEKLRREHPNLNVYCIFIKAPSMAELESRIVGRGQETVDKVKTRLETAKKEMAFIESPQGRVTYDNIFVNVDLDASVAHIEAICKRFGAL